MAKRSNDDDAAMKTIHFRVPASLFARIEELAARVAGANVSGVARQGLERGISLIEKNPAQELIRDAS